jgi:hypothetical protein
MEIPEHLRELVDRLGQALVQALVTDDQCRDLARQIQESGFEVGLMIEATLALHRRDEQAEGEEAADALEEQDSPIIQFRGSEGSASVERDRPQWSEEDRAFLRKFKISLD